MAGELNTALAQIKTDVATLTNVQKAMLGQPMESLSDATSAKAGACIHLMSGAPQNDTLTATEERHRIALRFYWLMSPHEVENIELAVATMWDVLMTKFFGTDGDRNLSEKSTITLVGGERGEPYQAGYEIISGKTHRVLVVPIEVILNTHAV